MKIFLSYAHEDKERVLELYRKLNEENKYDAWIDEEKLLPGQDWNLEINKAIKNCDAIILCLTNVSVNKVGYVQREMKNAIDLSQEHPEGDIFVIPVRLDECETPESVSRWHYVDLFTDNGYEKLLTALETKANRLSNGKLDITGNMAKRNSPKKIIDEVRSVAHELYNQANLALQENQDTLTPALQGLETSREAMQNMIGLFHRQRGRGFYHRWRTYLIELQKKPEANDTIIQELIGNLLSSLDDLIEIFYSTAKDFH